MATHKSALKRARQSEVRRIRNKSYKTKVKKAVKETRASVASNSAEQAGVSLSKTVALIQKSASKGVIHKNKAARKISRLARQVNQLTAS